MQLLTSSSLATLRRCPYQYYLRYELKLARARIDAPLRMGTSFHQGLECRGQGMDLAGAAAVVRESYATVPDWAEPTTWAIDRETVLSLLAGYYWRYAMVWGTLSDDRGGYKVRLLPGSAKHNGKIMALYNHEYAMPLGNIPVFHVPM